MPSTQRRSGYLIVYLAPRRLPAVLVAQLLCVRGAEITENPQSQFELHEGSGRYFEDNSATPRTAGAGASDDRRSELLAMEGFMGHDHLEVDAGVDAGVDHSSGNVWPKKWALVDCPARVPPLLGAETDRSQICLVPASLVRPSRSERVSQRMAT